MDTIDSDGLELVIGGAEKSTREQWGAQGRELGRDLGLSWPGMAAGGVIGEVAGGAYDYDQSLKRYNAATPAYYRDPRRLARAR
jgi:hypothetical protein